MTESLLNKRCVACEGGIPPLSEDKIKDFIAEYSDWQLKEDKTEIHREFSFKNYYHTMAFVNAVAWIAHQENHHPDMEVHYNKAIVRYSTHAVNGLTENDFICAAKIDNILN